MLKSVFFHIPKAAGTSVKDGFYHAYSYPTSLKIWPVAHGGDVEILDVLTHPLPADNPFECVMGHFNVGEFRANPSLMRDFSENGQFTLACVRDPFDRLLSDYNYIVNTPNHDRLDDVRRMSPIEYAEKHPENEQTRWLDITSVGTERLTFGTNDKITNNMIIVTSDTVDELLPRLFMAYTGRRIEIPRQNVGRAVPRQEKPQPSAQFMALNVTDYALVDFLRARGGVYIGPGVKSF